MSCRLCECDEYIKRDGSVRDDKTLEVLECTNCGLVYLSSLNHIDENFYEESNMHKDFDFIKWQNETKEDDERRFEFVKSMITNKTILDFGSGNGGFLLRAKKLASSVSAVELEKAVKVFYEENNIELFISLDDIDAKFDYISSFHVIEHLLEPELILQKMATLLKDDGKIIIEVPNADDALLTIYKSEAFTNFTYWSCHLYLYNQHTLSLLAKKANLHVEFIKHVQRYPLSNHLYWLSHNKPAGHTKWGNFIDSKELSSVYESQLASIGATDTIMAIFTKGKL